MASVGTAGGFAARGARVGSVYLSQGPFRYHGRHVPLPRLEDSVRGGHPSLDTTAWAIRSGLWYLANNPEDQERLRREPVDVGDRPGSGTGSGPRAGSGSGGPGSGPKSFTTSGFTGCI